MLVAGFEASDIIALGFGLMMLCAVVIGLFGIAAVIEHLVEIFLPESWKPAGIVYRREQKIIEVAKAARAARIAVRKTPAQIMAERLVAPGNDADLETAVAEAVYVREERGYAHVQENVETEEKARDENSMYVPIDLTSEIEQFVPKVHKPVVNTTPMQVKVHQVVIAIFPLTPYCKYCLGLSRGGKRMLWGSRRGAKIFMSDSLELKAFVQRAQIDGEDVFIVAARSRQILRQEQAKAKGATA